MENILLNFFVNRNTINIFEGNYVFGMKFYLD